MYHLCVVAAAVAVGFAGLAVCLIIICCGVVYLRRCDILPLSANYMTLSYMDYDFI